MESLLATFLSKEGLKCTDDRLDDVQLFKYFKDAYENAHQPKITDMKNILDLMTTVFEVDSDPNWV